MWSTSEGPTVDRDTLSKKRVPASTAGFKRTSNGPITRVAQNAMSEGGMVAMPDTYLAVSEVRVLCSGVAVRGGEEVVEVVSV